MTVELTKDEQIALALKPLVAAIGMHKVGRMDDRTLMVMNDTVFAQLRAIDPEQAEAVIRKVMGEAAL